MRKYSKKGLENIVPKKTHEKFMEELWLNNQGYREGFFTVVGKFKGVKRKVILRDKYGYCAVLPGDLTRGVVQRLTIKSAMFKTEYLKEYLRQNNKNFYKYTFRIMSDYVNSKTEIYAIDSLGTKHKIKPISLLKGCDLSIKSAVDRNDFLFRKICSRNQYFKSGCVEYIYSFVKDQKCFIKCSDEYGDYIMDVSVAYSGSRPTIEVATDKDKNLVNRLSKNGSDYDYSKVKYVGIKNKVTIVCKAHGKFTQKCQNHINGEGCPKCGIQSRIIKNAENPSGWTYTNWIKAGKISKNFDSFKVYVVKMQSLDGEEEFYKIGKTFLSIKKRFSGIKNYKITGVVKIIESEDGRVITEKERELLNLNKKFRYNPKETFRGYMECFSEVIYD